MATSGSQDAAKDVADRSRFADALGGRGRGRVWQAQELVEGTPVRHQIGGDQLLSGGRESEGIQAEMAADAGVGVVTEAAGISDAQQEQIQCQGIGSAGGGEAASEEALVAPTEAGWDLAEAIRAEEDFWIIHVERGGPAALCRRISRPLASMTSQWRRMSSCSALPIWMAINPTNTGGREAKGSCSAPGQGSCNAMGDAWIGSG